jgi:hypothetical protein
LHTAAEVYRLEQARALLVQCGCREQPDGTWALPKDVPDQRQGNRAG